MHNVEDMINDAVNIIQQDYFDHDDKKNDVVKNHNNIDPSPSTQPQVPSGVGRQRIVIEPS